MKTKNFFMVALFLVLAVSTAYAAEQEYIIGKGDMLSIRVWGEDALSSDAVVRPDGRISLPGIGSLHAAGLTTPQLQNRIAAKLKELVFEPMVSVAVHSFPNNSVVVHGPGTKSAVMPLIGGTTVLQLLSQLAPDHNADLENAYIERGGKRIASNFHELFREGTGHGNNVEMLAGDRLFIPLREARLVFIEGAVGRPTSLPYFEGMTILEAIHMAGGFTKFADKNSTTILRPTPDGHENIPVRLHDLTAKGDFSQNVPVRGGDIIVVKTSWF